MFVGAVYIAQELIVKKFVICRTEQIPGTTDYVGTTGWIRDARVTYVIVLEEISR